jgi:hypothetical protein
MQLQRGVRSLQRIIENSGTDGQCSIGIHITYLTHYTKKDIDRQDGCTDKKEVLTLVNLSSSCQNACLSVSPYADCP